jgi:hypothetical protein
VRVAAGDRVLAPFDAPNEVIAPSATVSGTYVFDVPPATRHVVLRATVGSNASERPFELRD